MRLSQNLAAAGVIDFSFSNALSAPWRNLRADRKHRGLNRLSKTPSISNRRSFSSDHSSGRVSETSSALEQTLPIQPPTLPDCLRHAPTSRLGLGTAATSSTVVQLFPPPFSYGKTLVLPNMYRQPQLRRYIAKFSSLHHRSDVFGPIYSTILHLLSLEFKIYTTHVHSK